MISAAVKRYTLAAPGIYRDSRTGNFYERPWIDGRRTFRKLRSPSLKLAKEELAARRIDQGRSAYGLARDPYAPALLTVGVILDLYEQQGCPDRHRQPRLGVQLGKELNRIKHLREFWARRLAEKLKPRDCVDYFNTRKKGRAVDLELSTLSSALNWAVDHGRLEVNPLHRRPRFRPKAISHCRDFMPTDGDELHALAAHLFSSRRSEVLGWQLLLEAMTGCRTSEILRLRWDARRGQAGFIEGDWLWLNRSKGGVNPFCQLHPALRETLTALKAWRNWRRIKGQWFLPSARKQGPVGVASLTHALAIVAPLVCGAKRTSHGLRAYYVTARRSQGVADAQIAAEIGDKSGASIIVSTYGAIPPNWQGRTALTWMPSKEKPAWTVFTGMRAGMPAKKKIVPKKA